MWLREHVQFAMFQGRRIIPSGPITSIVSASTCGLRTPLISAHSELYLVFCFSARSRYHFQPGYFCDDVHHRFRIRNLGCSCYHKVLRLTMALRDSLVSDRHGACII